MKTLILYFLVATVLLLLNEIEKLREKVRKQEKRINLLCEKTGNYDMSTDYISEDLKDELLRLKREKREVEAVKLLRKNTSLSLLEAKKYIDEI